MIALGQLGLVPVLYAPGASGVPATTRPLPDLRWRMRAIDWSIADMFGFESCTISFPAPADEALFWLDQLMASLVVYDYDASVCWEGYLLGVEAQIGSETHSRSLDGMQNRIVCRFTTALGVPGFTSSATNNASIAKYGTKDGVVTSTQTRLEDAQATRDAVLAARAWPVRETRASLQNDTTGAASVVLRFAGWYDTLGWVNTSRNDTTTQDTDDQIAALIGTVSPGIGATNAFLSTSSGKLTATNNPASRLIPEDTPFRSKIEALAGMGNNADERMAWGVYEARTFYLTAWAGTTPDTIDYVRSISDGLVRTTAGVIVPFWRVRPNKMVQIREFLPSAAQQGAGRVDRYPIGRVTFSAGEQGLSLTLDPPESSSLDARLARIGGS